MWSYDPASGNTKAALDFLTSYGAPQPQLIQHPKPLVNIMSFLPSDVDNLLLLQLYDLQERYTENAVTIYIGAVQNWKLNLTQQPQLAMPPIPDLPALIPPIVELLFGSYGIDAPLVVVCPHLALRLLRRAQVVSGDPDDYTPFPRPDPKPVDNRVIGDENLPGNPGYFASGPADHFPNHYIYTLDGKSYLKLASPFGAVWMLVSN